MNLKQITEVLAMHVEDGYDFADIDIKGLYDTIIPKRLHYLEPEEIQEIRDYLDLDNVKTEQELRAIRNSIVQYCYDESKPLRDKNDELAAKWQKENPSRTFADFMAQNPYDIMWDQMSAFTHVIDMELYKRFNHA